MNDLMAKLNETKEFIQSKTKIQPQIAIILGTGIGDLANIIDIDITIPYKDIPHFAVSTVESHSGNLIFGNMNGKEVVIMQGRLHFYEGYSIQDVVYPIRTAKIIGVETIIVTNASGGMNPNYELSDLVLITDHINLMGVNPLIGPNIDELGPRFPDMSNPYEKEYIKLAEDIALENKIRLHKGVYVGVAGPNLETAAEYRFLRMIGADVVGMSLVAEDIAAVHCGLKVIAVAFVTDLCFPDNLKPALLEHILETAKKAEPKMNQLVSELVKKL